MSITTGIINTPLTVNALYPVLVDLHLGGLSLQETPITLVVNSICSCITNEGYIGTCHGKGGQ